MELTEEQIKQGLDKAYKAAGHNAYFCNGFEAGVRFTLEQLRNCNLQNVMLSLLKTAKCPDCDGSGAKIVETTKMGTKWVDDGNGNPLPDPVLELDYDLEQCEWCYHRNMLLSNEAQRS